MCCGSYTRCVAMCSHHVLGQLALVASRGELVRINLRNVRRTEL